MLGYKVLQYSIQFAHLGCKVSVRVLGVRVLGLGVR